MTDAAPSSLAPTRDASSWSADSAPAPAAPPLDLRVAALVAPDYELVAALGQGAMGQVFRARHARLGHHVAIKVLSHDTGSSRLVQEARVLALLRHDHIVPIVDLVERPGGGAFFVMGLVDGEPLDRLIGRTGLHPEHARVLFHQIADALAAVHRRGLVHRDVKPANIVVSGSSATLVDFGLALPPDEGGRAAGSRPYMAPEQWEGRFDYRSDVFALGASLYHALSGAPPFDETTGFSRDARAAPSLRAHAPDVPRGLAALVARCLAREPAARYADGAAVGHAFDSLMRRRRRKRLAIVVALALLPVLAAVVTMLALGTRALERQQALALAEGALAAQAAGDPAAARARIRSSLELADTREGRLAWQRIARDRLLWSLEVPENPYAFDVGGEHVAVAVAGAARIIDLATGSERETYAEAHPVVAVGLVPDDDTVVLLTSHELVAIDPTSGTRRRVAHPGIGRFSELYAASSGAYVATPAPLASSGWLVWHWDLTRPQLTLLRHHQAKVVAFATDRSGGLWSVDNAGVLVTPHDPAHPRRLWTTPSETYITRLGLVFDDAGAPRIARVSADGVIEIHDAGRVTHIGGAQRGTLGTELGPGGRLLAAPTRPSHVTIWNVATGHRDSWATPDRTQRLRFAPDGGTLVTAHPRSLKAWRVIDPATAPTTLGRSGSSYAVAFDASGMRVALTDATHAIQIVEIPGARRVGELVGHTAAVVNLLFDPQRDRLYSTADDHTTRVWDLATGDATTLTTPGHSYWDVSLHPTLPLLATANDDPWVNLWDVGAAPHHARRLASTRAWSSRVHFTRDGRWLVAGGAAGRIEQWDTTTWEPRTGPGGAVVGSGTVTAIVEHGDGSLWLGSRGGSLQRWDPEAAAPIGDLVALDAPGLVTLAPRADGWVVVTADAVIATDAAFVAQRRARVHEAETFRAAFSPDGRRVATIGDPGHIALWDLDAWQPIPWSGSAPIADAPPRQRTPPTSDDITAHVRLDDERVVDGHANGAVTLRTLDVGSGVAIERGVTSACVALGAGPGGTVVGGFANGQVLVWDPHDGARLVERWVHGPARHLTLDGATIVAASSLGDRVRIDLSDLTRSHCDVLRAIWRAVPLVWRDGRVMRSAPPDGGCR